VVGPNPGGDAFRNSVLALYPPTDSRLDPRYVVGLLNSRVLRFAYASAVREAHQRAFPQVKLSALGALPIRLPETDGERRHAAAVIELVDALLRPACDERERLEEEVEREVYGLYGLEAHEIATVEAACAKLPSVPRFDA
jgi:hypothetical protein